MVRIALFPIVGIAVLCIIAAVVTIVVAVVARSPKQKLWALVPIGGVAGLLLLAGALAAARTSLVREVAMTERMQRDQASAAMRAVREEHRIAYQSQVLDYRGDSRTPVIIDPVTSAVATPIEVVSYSPTGEKAEQTLSSLPDWVGEATEFDPAASHQFLVLSSYPKLTVEEANEELYELLAVDAGEFLSAAYPDAAGWYPERESLEEMPLIQEAVTERFPLEVSAEHTVDMRRAHWRVELTPEIREGLFELWRPTIVQQRLLQLAGGLGVLTLLFAMTAGAFRFQARRAGRRLANMN